MTSTPGRRASWAAAADPDTLAAVCELLEVKLVPGRAAASARQSGDADGGLTMLELIAAGGEAELLASLESSFPWAEPA